MPDPAAFAGELRQLILVALLNPAVILVAFYMGRRASEPQKIVVAAFASAAAGTVLAIVAHRLGVDTGNPKSVAGLFSFSLVFGAAWAWIGWRTRRQGPRDDA